MSALELRDISVEIDGTPLLTSVSLTVAAGQFVGIVGPNGAGKTTLLRVAAGLLAPSRGEVLVGGEPLASLSARQRARAMALVPQDTTLPFSYSVGEVAALGRVAHLGRFDGGGPRDDDIVSSALGAVGLMELAARPIDSLSGGERQRVFIAKALAQEPKVLLLDEPIASLDVGHQLTVLRLLRGQARSGVAVVVVLHDLNVASRVCDELLLLRGGHVQAMGSAEDVLTTGAVESVYEVGAIVSHDHRVDAPSVYVHDHEVAAVARPVHVIGGHGSAASIMGRLHRSGIAFSTGPVNVGDIDHVVGRQLGTEVIEVPAGIPQDDAVDELIDACNRSSVVVVPAVPSSPANRLVAGVLADLPNVVCIGNGDRVDTLHECVGGDHIDESALPAYVLEKATRSSKARRDTESKVGEGKVWEGTV